MKTKVFDIIIVPHNTEKATVLNEINKYTFKVAKDSTSSQIKSAVEGIFSTEVIKVNIMNVQGKKKVFKGRPGKRSGYKKAIVTLKKGKTIDISAGAK